MKKHRFILEYKILFKKLLKFNSPFGQAPKLSNIFLNRQQTCDHTPSRENINNIKYQFGFIPTIKTGVVDINGKAQISSDEVKVFSIDDKGNVKELAGAEKIIGKIAPAR